MSASALNKNPRTLNRASLISSMAAVCRRIRLGNPALFPTGFLFSPNVGIWAPVLLVILLCAAPHAFGGQNRLPRSTSFSIPVSPSVVSTIATTDERLVPLVLWRGAERWYSSGQQRASGGGGQDGTIHVSLEYGDITEDLLFDPRTHTAIVQGRTNPVPSNANVLLIDGVGRGGSGRLVKAFFFDPRDANTDIRRGSLAPLFARSPEIVAFLQCNAFPEQVKSWDPCAVLKKQ